MDYTGIINLALVTLFFSTILAPNLKKIGDIKDEISSIEFPIISENKNDDTERGIAEKGIELTKKLTQYADKYGETKKFLRYFYAILSIIVVIQLIVMYLQNSLWGVSGILFLGSVLVVAFVIKLINVFMIDPSVVRSIQWLADKGIAGVYTENIFKPKLTLNTRVANIKAESDRISIGVRSNADLNGYGYLLVIESRSYEKLYVVSVGFINSRHSKTTIAYPNGETGSETVLANYRLNPGQYTARLLFLSQVYGGNYAPSETVIEFDVTRNKETGTKTEPIRHRGNSCGYLLTVKNKDNKQKIIHMEASESFKGDKNLTFILSSAPLLKYLSKGHRPIVFYSRNGDIDKYDLQKYLSIYSVWKRRIYRRLKNPQKASKGHMVLLNRNPKSKLKSS